MGCLKARDGQQCLPKARDGHRMSPKIEKNTNMSVMLDILAIFPSFHLMII